MKELTFDKAIQTQFDNLTRKVIMHTTCNYHNELSRRSKREILFSDVSEAELNSYGTMDKYIYDYTSFDVLGLEVQVFDERLSNAIQELNERKREVILLSYFLNMSDAEIAQEMKLVRATIHKHRVAALREIKKIMEDKNV